MVDESIEQLNANDSSDPDRAPAVGTPTQWTLEAVTRGVNDAVRQHIGVSSVEDDECFLLILREEHGQARHITNPHDIVAHINAKFALALPAQLIFVKNSVNELAEEVYRQLSMESSDDKQLYMEQLTLTTYTPPPLSYGQEECWFRYQRADNVDEAATKYVISKTRPLNIKMDGAKDGRRSALRHWWGLQRQFQKDCLFRSVFFAFGEDDAPVQMATSSTDAYYCPDVYLTSTKRVSSTPVKVPKIPLSHRRTPVWLRYQHTDKPEVRLCMQKVLADQHTLGQLLDSAMEETPAPNVKQMPLQYADFAMWQKQHKTLETQTKYLQQWKQLLADVEEIQLPTDRTPSAAEYDTVHQHCEEVDGHRFQQAVRLCRERLHCDLKHLMLAVFYAHLSQMVEAKTMAIATLSSLKDSLPENARQLLGNFENVLMLPLTKAPRSVTKLVAYVKTVTDKAAEIEVPAQVLAEFMALQKLHNVSEQTFRKVFFSHRHSNTENELPTATTLPDFNEYSLEVTQYNEKLALTFKSRSCFFKESLVEFARQCVYMLTTVLQSEDKLQTGDLNEICITPRKHQATVHSFSKTIAKDYPVKELGWSQRIQRVMKNNPTDKSLINGERHLSFEQLQRSALTVSAAIRQDHIATTGNAFIPGSLVGLVGDETVEAYCGVLGTVFAGGAYVPISSMDPKNRKHHIVEDASLSAVLAKRNVHHEMAENKIRFLDELLSSHKYTTGAAKHRRAVTTPADMGYIIYTSGTTGAPKGVCVPQKSIIADAQNTIEEQSISRVTAQPTRLTFDPSVAQMLSSLFTSATLLLPADKLDLPPLVRDIPLLSYLDHTPTALLGLGKKLTRLMMPKVERCNVGGEACPATLAEILVSNGAVCRNMYGPTEVTDAVTVNAIQNGDRKGTIGSPMKDCCAFIIRPSTSRRVPIGHFGEAVFAGDCLSTGYLRLPEKTDTVFVPNPFQTTEQRLRRKMARIYRTGDKMRWAGDGQMLFSGRIDQQIKLRGYRIELEEIESLLCACPHVSTAAVVVLTDDAGTAQNLLAAYVPAKSASETDQTAEDGGDDAEAAESQTGDAIRDWLANSLAPFMMPAYFVAFDSLATHLSSGKLNKPLIKEMGLAKIHTTDTTSTRVASHAEVVLMNIWHEVLTVFIGAVKPESNFFALGGNSLLTLQLRTKLANHLQMDIKVADIFRYPTVRSFANFLNAQKSADSEADVSTLVPMRTETSRLGTLFCPHALVAGSVFVYKRAFEQANARWPGTIYGVDHPNTFDEQMLHCPADAQGLIDLYLKDMKASKAEKPYALFGLSMGGVIAHLMNETLPNDEKIMTILLDCDPFSDNGTTLFPVLRDLEKAVKYFIPEVDEVTLKQLTRNSYELWTVFNAYHKREFKLANYPIFHFQAEEAFEFELENYGMDYSDYTKLVHGGWCGIAGGRRLPYDLVPGNHITMTTNANVQKLAVKTCAIMAELSSVAAA